MKKFMFSLSLMISLSMIPARAIIPFNQAMDVFEETKDEWKAISPFWGMVALHGKLLEQIRFFGPYSSLVEDEATRQLQESLIHPSLLPKPTAGDGPLCSEYPLDPIAALIQHLFPCTDGVQFVANTRNQDPVGNLSRHLDKINDLIQILLDQSKIEEKRNKIFSTLKSLDKNTKTKVNKSFAHLLVDAYQRQNQLANPMRPDQQLYPENIVVISLLSFFCQVADYQCDFDKLPFLMKMEDTTKHVFTKGNYYNFRLRDKTTLDQIIADTHHPELAFLMGKGYEVYENFASDPIPYRGDISYKTSPAFPDCGETSLRNVLMLILEDQGTIPETFLRTLEKKIIPIPDLIIQDPK
ncbi:MAG TPA: hypothetical protein VNJ29_03615, partial [Candidatus Nitrosotenuis sp.]|nr:hypothetical protein [Candidatus Nitrosotenuis sp.]